ncbi:M23 family metallopeptidase [Actinophytocola oryzae]|uniref:Peptidase M23-like protein n=1 Tax=Actinophytocola oryzae TaxID=502181 RepID=A0A4R7W4L1_9PSEU|nr:M23 family metallopeptidase [Actinophytocola oryzae]TDV57462.1 peptidase M23-like protein [Actinophytocola oryzae]
MSYRKAFVTGVVAVLTAVLTAAPAQARTPADVGITAAHKSPFSCGKTFYANNWSPGHSPSGAIDWQTYGSDAVGGETVRATASGTAQFSTTLSLTGDVGILAYGNYVVITHGDGTRTRYAHLATMVRSPGQSMSVSQGTAIGTVGGTGGDYAPHLHYEQITASGALDTSPTVEGVTVSLGQKKAVTSTNNCGGNPYTPEEVCGSGFGVVDSAALTGGRVYLLYNSGSSDNCVVTLKSTSLGTASATSAFLEPQGSTRTTDSGSYAYYAGPVKRHAPSVCVKWGGSVGASTYTSPFEHCA